MIKKWPVWTSVFYFAILLYFATIKCFWLDDFAQIDMVYERSFVEMIINVLQKDNNPPLSHIVSWLWIKMVPHNSYFLKLPSIFFVSIGCLAVTSLAREAFGERAAIFSFLIYAININIAILAAYTFRPYGLLVGISAVCIYCFYMRSKGRCSDMYCFIINLMIIYTHYFGFLEIVILGIADWLLLKKSYKWYRVYYIPCLCFVPWIVLVYKKTITLARNFWTIVPDFFMVKGTIDALSINWVLLLGAVIVITVNCLINLGKDGLELEVSEFIGVLLIVPFIQMLMVLVYSLFFKGLSSLWVTRYFCGLVPFFVLIIGRAGQLIVGMIFSESGHHSYILLLLALLGMIFNYKINIKNMVSDPYEECIDIVKELLVDDSVIFHTDYPTERGWEYFFTSDECRERNIRVTSEILLQELEDVKRIYVLILHNSPIEESEISYIEDNGFVLKYMDNNYPVYIMEKEKY